MHKGQGSHSKPRGKEVGDGAYPDLLLFEFLHRCKAQSDFHIYHSMFNKEFKMSSILEQHKDFLSNHLAAFHELTQPVELRKVAGHLFISIKL